MTGLALLAAANLLCVVVAQHLAILRGRPARGWMMAAAWLGPLPLVPLLVLRRRT